MTHFTMALRRQEAREEEKQEEEGVCWPMGKPCPAGTARLAGKHFEITEEDVARHAREEIWRDIS